MTSPFDSDHSIDIELYKLIRMILPEGKTILELGSGEGTQALVKHWKVVSVEDDKEYIGLYHDNYIHAPLVEHKAVGNHTYPGHKPKWYGPQIMKKVLPTLEYDLLLIDGPVTPNRSGVVKYWDLFKQDVPVIIDDVNRKLDWRIAVSLSQRLKRPFTVYNTWSEEDNATHFALIQAPNELIPTEVL